MTTISRARPSQPAAGAGHRAVRRRRRAAPRRRRSRRARGRRRRDGRDADARRAGRALGRPRRRAARRAACGRATSSPSRCPTSRGGRWSRWASGAPARPSRRSARCGPPTSRRACSRAPYPRLAIAFAPLAGSVRGALDAAGLDDVDLAVVGGEAAGATPIEALLGLDAGDPYAEPDLGPDDLAAVPFSSGTGGLPKGVRLTHGNLAAGGRAGRSAPSAPAAPTTSARWSWPARPFFHSIGLALMLCAPLRLGATIVTLPRPGLEPLLELVAAHRVTHIAVPPPLFDALAADPRVDEHDLSSLRLVVTGGAHMQPRRRAGAQRAPGLPGAPGLRDDRGDVHDQRPARPPEHAGDRRLAHARHRGAARRPRDRRRRGARGAGRAVGPRPAGHAGLPRPARGDRRGPSRPTAGCAPATSSPSATTASSRSATASRSSSRSRAPRWRPPRSSSCCASIRPSTTPASSGVPDAERGEAPIAFVALDAPAGARGARGVRRRAPGRATSARARSWSSTRCRAWRRASCCAACCASARPRGPSAAGPRQPSPRGRR